jgi:hypothetical protein
VSYEVVVICVVQFLANADGTGTDMAKSRQQGTFRSMLKRNEMNCNLTPYMYKCSAI